MIRLDICNTSLDIRNPHMDPYDLGLDLGDPDLDRQRIFFDGSRQRPDSEDNSICYIISQHLRRGPTRGYSSAQK